MRTQKSAFDLMQSESANIAGKGSLQKACFTAGGILLVVAVMLSSIS